MRKLLRLVRLRIELNIFLEQKSNRKSKAESKTEVTVLHSSMVKKYRVNGILNPVHCLKSGAKTSLSKMI